MSLWESYKTSIFLCHQALKCDVDFAIISAQNPAGHTEHPYLNLRRDKELQACLNQQRLPYRSVIGSAPDLTYQEKSWIVLCDKQQAIELALQFEQNAIYWVERGELFLVPVLLQQPEESLGAFSPRLVLLND
ncbi:DUF3293 domain-containing protein [Rheinheimera muenzenbergensis]|uniref:DUF3293 domain-containing protein n=1 Tax=Rheinheimera muenzenbergensis TaxID=1193628 RepID=A0ABU8C385_9GAMM|nr:DUF3293 domain-containing protein [Gammaproteobacteria bacterium]MBU1556992.1 DUF3293 domain-containing protein [Gammaproteobacteria bacterium]MBU2071124.1 DUF3293 domain-containing protein [Gammaproteobacteria bacterium]MBU2183057.1 DUF3293 domain-containing protein [Gammaproteobacteria bacterium]MBU2203183.1 DUF3293 domain-containing protein [Gammaproteobacteria bacterium]